MLGHGRVPVPLSVRLYSLTLSLVRLEGLTYFLAGVIDLTLLACSTRGRARALRRYAVSRLPGRFDEVTSCAVLQALWT